MNKTIKIIIWLIVALIILLFAYQLFSRPVEDSSIQIGFIGPLSGEMSDRGESAKKVINLAFEEINNAGGIDGKKIEVIYEDGGCNGKDAVKAMKRLIKNEKIKVVIGGLCSSESLAIVSVAEENKILLLSPGSSSSDLTNSSEYFIRTYPSDSIQGEVLSKIAYKDKQWKKVAFIQEQLDYPVSIFEAFQKSFESMGGEVIKEEFLVETSDFSPPLTRLKSEDPDAIFINIETLPIIEIILKQIRDLKWELPLLVTDVIGNDIEIVEKNFELLEGALTAELSISTNNERFEQLSKNYELKYKEELSFQSYAQAEYDTVFMLKDAIKEVGYEVDKIADWLRSVKDWQGASGSITLGSDGDRDGGYISKIILDGKTIELKQDSE